MGILYCYGYFKQVLFFNGDQIYNFFFQEFIKLFVVLVCNENGDWIKISVNLLGWEVQVKVWVLKVGCIFFYLFDIDIDENSWEDCVFIY